MKATVSQTQDYRRYYLSEFELFGGDHYITFNIVDANTDSNEITVAAGVPIVTVSARAGHVHTSTTSDFYAHFLRSSDVSAANTIENMFVQA